MKRELADFVAAVREKRAPGVTGADGLRAIDLAQRITDEMKAGLRPALRIDSWDSEYALFRLLD